ncbi:MAG: RdgB/HAM1 family non-canonical purine NTP pyrophosphatase [Bdellovibrionota bacterium]
MEIWVASGNKGKIREFEGLLKEFPEFKLHSQSEMSAFTPRPEDGKTFIENARIKARTLRSVKNSCWVFGEDSGLEVEGLGGLPGIHSARYAGPKASDNENVAKLLKMMSLRAVPNRNAQFKCAMIVYTPEGEEKTFEGIMKGQIASKPSGQMGFGYDPVFIPEGQKQSLAELGPGYKNQHSHRAEAFKQFLAQFSLSK